MHYPSRNRWRFLLAGGCFCLGLLAPPTHAADAALTLGDAIAATLAANPLFKLHPLRKEALEGERTTVSLNPPWVLNGAVEDALGTGSVSGIDRTEFTLTLSRVVELGDQHQRHIDAAGLRISTLEAEQRVEELDLLTEATRRFIHVAASQERLAQQQRTAALAEATLAGVRTLVGAAQSPIAEQSRAEADLALARLAEQEAAATLAADRQTLVASWASREPDSISVAADFYTVGTAADLTPLLLAVSANPAIAIYASEERLREAELQAALSERRGQVQWSAGLRHLREGRDFGLVLGVSRPLGSTQRGTGAIASAAANLKAVAAEREIAEARMQSELLALHTRLQQAIASAGSLRNDVLPVLATALEQTRAAYIGGRYGYADLVSAQRTLLDTERTYIDTVEQVHLLRAEIERLTGADFTASTALQAPGATP